MRSIMTVAFMCVAAATAFAETSATPTTQDGADAGKSKHWQACTVDIQKFCGDVEKGKGLIRACLNTHSAELSDGCKTSMAEHAAKEKDKAAQ